MLTKYLVVFALLIHQPYLVGASSPSDLLSNNEKLGSAHPGWSDVRHREEAMDTSRTANSIKLLLSGAASVTSKDRVPFWMRANQYGSVPLPGISTSLVGEVRRDYDLKNRRLVDWGFGAEGRFNAGSRTQFLLIQGYLKGRIGIFQLKAGRSRDVVGLVDSTLSSGSFSISGNALGIPKVELSVPQFWTVPILGGIFAFKGNFAHGWVGDMDVRYATGKGKVNTFLHQKSFYGRFGKPNWRLKIFAGFNHQAFWGNEKKMNPKKFKLSTLETYKYVILGKSYGERGTGLPLSKVGNHIGSIDQALEYEFEKFQLNAYHQFFYEVGGLYHLNNVKDGLWGLTYTNKGFRESTSDIRINKIVVEFMSSKSQGGEIDAKITPSGDEDYYNNYLYPKGWTYKGENLGNPLLTSKKYARTNLPAIDEYFVNNRVQAIHLGLDGAISKFVILCRLTMSQNYGTYGTSPWGHSLNTVRDPSKPPYFGEEGQFSGYLEASRPIKSLNVGLCVALDRGTMIYNSSGLWLKISKTW